VVLKVDWTESGGTDPGAHSGFRCQYSTDGGSGWTNVFEHLDVNANTNGSNQVTLSNAQDLTQVQVRDRLQATGTGGGANASLTGALSNIRVEVVTLDTSVVVMM